MAHKGSAYNTLVVLVACLASFTYGYSVSILGNALSKPAFYQAMNLDLVGEGASYTTSIIALWNGLIYIGAMIACLSYPLISKRWGRRIPIFLSGITYIIGGGLQSGSVNPAMVCVARTIQGFSLGWNAPGVPMYQAEVARPTTRGLMVGLHPSTLGFGTMMAQWVGVAFFYAGGQTGWRVPFAINTVPAFLLVVLIWFVPESPRWLYMNGQHDKAQEVLIKLHRVVSDPEDTYAKQEYMVMKSQIDLEARTPMTISRAFKTPSLRKRLIIGWLTMSGTQFTGLLVILTYQQVIYSNLGFSNFMVGVLGGIWCTLNGVGNFIGGYTVDRVGRVRQLVFGYICSCVCLIFACILTALYSDGQNKAGNRAAVFFIFAIIFLYTIGVEAPSFVYTSELFPSEFRGIGVSFSMTGLFTWCIVFPAVGSPAFANIGYRYYIVFATLSAAMIFVVGVFFPETKGYSLEQIAAKFGEDVVDSSGHAETAEEFIAEKQAHSSEIEFAVKQSNV